VNKEDFMQLVVIEKRIVDYVVKLQETQIDSDEVSSMLVCEFIHNPETDKIEVLDRKKPDDMYVTEGLARKIILHPLFSEALNKIIYDKSNQILATGFNVGMFVEGLCLEDALNFSLSLDIKRK
jgi:hypothetical protein